jgi:predicted ester cyclase
VSTLNGTAWVGIARMLPRWWPWSAVPVTAVAALAEEDKVVARFTCSGIQQGPFMGSPPTGRRQEVDEVYIPRVKHERVVDF